MSSRVFTLLKNPLVIIPPLVIILAFGWRQYTYAGRNLSLPQGVNLLGSFSQFDSNGIPAGWQLTGKGQFHYTTGQADGYAGGQAFRLMVDSYQNGDIALTSPKITVTPGSTYLFKGYYTASTPFSLLARMYQADGSSSLSLVQNYPAATGDWSTASDAFKAAPGTVAVQFVFRAYGNGSLELNSLYLESRQDVYVPALKTGTNLIPNNTLSPGDNNTPTDWSTYHAGSNTAAFSYLQDSLGAYVETQVSNYASGEAKWQYPPQAVQPHQYYQMSLAYQSDAPVSIVAEYVLGSGVHQYQTVATVEPADQWTTVTYPFEVPSDAVNVFVSLPLQHDGTLDTRNYQVINITKSPAIQWPGPLVSLTFDGGQQSQYQNALPILQHDGYKGTFYINPATIETKGYMTASELTDLSGSGDEIGARGYNPDDMTAINSKALDYQLHEGRDYLRTAGFQVTDFAAPFGRSDAEVQYYARQDFATLRGTETGINTWQNFDPYNLKVLNISMATTPQKLSAALAAAKAEDGWLIIVYQGVGGVAVQQSPLSSNINITSAAFKEQMDLIKKNGIAVTPIAAAYAAIQHQ